MVDRGRRSAKSANVRFSGKRDGPHRVDYGPSFLPNADVRRNVR